MKKNKINFNYSPAYEAEERPVNRREIEKRYAEMYKKLQRHDEMAVDMVEDARSRFYAGLDPRRRQEVADAGMVQEDPHAIANLSPRFIHREYSNEGFYSTPFLDDLAYGPDRFDGEY